MSQASESLNSPPFRTADDSAVGVGVTESESGRAFPGRVRGQRLEITKADLTMYSVITGRAPSSEERERALHWTDADPLQPRIAGVVARSTSMAVVPAHAMRPWHPTALSLRVRDIWFNGLTIKMNRPQISGWVRRLSNALHTTRRGVRHVP